MKAYKVGLLIIDNENIGEDEIRDRLENCRYVYPSVMNIQSAEIGEFHDDHPLNKKDTFEEEYNRIFNK